MRRKRGRVVRGQNAERTIMLSRAYIVCDQRGVIRVAI
jgi:hypothetical protein